ncbi:hypothetical protein ACFSSC_05350 [Corynebacterium mendelii]|uniref:Uncharacterized protein n=1 Tax=Corynebacterium mendelii TaxID=2765362 RepID=A0A939IW96_9CORY|nr:hypothetical protein [Corynebacterium mendelii]MBN9643175.1 hypothetical protein [Corynebacterium mendelii]
MSHRPHTRICLLAASLVVTAPFVASCSASDTAVQQAPVEVSSVAPEAAAPVEDQPEPGPDDYVAVCVNPDTGQRVDDEECPDQDSFEQTDQHVHYYGGSPITPFLWFYLGTQLGGRQPFIPPVGSPVQTSGPNAGTVTTQRPVQGKVFTGAPQTGGSFADSVKSARTVNTVSGGSVTRKQAVAGAAAGAAAGTAGSTKRTGGFGKPKQPADGKTGPEGKTNNNSGQKPPANKGSRTQNRTGGFGGGKRSGGGHRGG